MKNYDDVLVSIIVPVYKCETTIQKCIESIVRQTHRRIEIIIILDGKADNSPQICKDNAEKDNRIKILEQDNQGVSVARNRGIDFSNGEWIIFVDGDDWIEDNCVEVLLKEAEESLCDIIISGYYIHDRNRSWKYSFFKYNNKKSFFNADDKENLLINCLIDNHVGRSSWGTNVGVPWAKLYRKSFLQKNNLTFIQGLSRMQDTIFNLYAFWYSSLTVLIPENLYHYTFNEKSVTKSYNKDFSDIANKVLFEIQKFIDVTNSLFLNEAMWEKTVLLIYEMIQLQFLPKECTLKRIEKIKRIGSIINNPDALFKENIKKSHTYYLTAKARVFCWLLKLHQYAIIYLFMEAKAKIKNY